MIYYSVTINYMHRGQPHVVWRLIKATSVMEADEVFNKWVHAHSVPVLEYKIQDAIGEN